MSGRRCKHRASRDDLCQNGFIVKGPRSCGKDTFAFRKLLSHFKKLLYHFKKLLYHFKKLLYHYCTAYVRAITP